MCGVAGDARQRLATQPVGGGLEHQHQRGSAVVDGRAGRGGDGAVLLEGGLEAGHLVEPCLARALVGVDHGLARARLDGDGRNLGSKRTRLDGRLRTLHAGNGKGVLLRTGKAVFGGAVLAKGAHGAAGLVGIFQAIEHHVVKDAVVAQAVAATAFLQQVRCGRHAFHAAHHHHVVRACQQHVVRHHGGLHARAAHFGQRDRARFFG